MKPARLLLALFLFLVAGLFGCSGNSSSGSTPPPVTNGQLYALNGVTGTVLHFSAGGSGNIAPAASIHGPATQLSSPDFALAHGANDRLFVSDAGSSVLIFERARTKNGNVAPDRTIAGAATQLVGPGAMALDTVRDQLYISAGFGSMILVFAPASTVNGNVAPTRVLSPGFLPGRITLDSANNRLFVVDASNGIQIYDNASTLNGGSRRTGPSPALPLNCFFLPVWCWTPLDVSWFRTAACLSMGLLFMPTPVQPTEILLPQQLLPALPHSFQRARTSPCRLRESFLWAIKVREASWSSMVPPLAMLLPFVSSRATIPGYRWFPALETSEASPSIRHVNRSVASHNQTALTAENAEGAEEGK